MSAETAICELVTELAVKDRQLGIMSADTEGLMRLDSGRVWGLICDAYLEAHGFEPALRGGARLSPGRLVDRVVELMTALEAADAGECDDDFPRG